MSHYVKKYQCGCGKDLKHGMEDKCQKCNSSSPPKFDIVPFPVKKEKSVLKNENEEENFNIIMELPSNVNGNKYRNTSFDEFQELSKREEKEKEKRFLRKLENSRRYRLYRAINRLRNKKKNLEKKIFFEKQKIQKMSNYEMTISLRDSIKTQENVVSTVKKDVEKIDQEITRKMNELESLKDCKKFMFKCSRHSCRKIFFDDRKVYSCVFCKGFVKCQLNIPVGVEGFTNQRPNERPNKNEGNFVIIRDTNPWDEGERKSVNGFSNVQKKTVQKTNDGPNKITNEKEDTREYNSSKYHQNTSFRGHRGGYSPYKRHRGGYSPYRGRARVNNRRFFRPPRVRGGRNNFHYRGRNYSANRYRYRGGSGRYRNNYRGNRGFRGMRGDRGRITEHPSKRQEKEQQQPKKDFSGGYSSYYPEEEEKKEVKKEKKMQEKNPHKKTVSGKVSVEKKKIEKVEKKKIEKVEYPKKIEVEAEEGKKKPVKRRPHEKLNRPVFPAPVRNKERRLRNVQTYLSLCEKEKRLEGDIKDYVENYNALVDLELYDGLKQVLEKIEELNNLLSEHRSEWEKMRKDEEKKIKDQLEGSNVKLEGSKNGKIKVDHAKVKEYDKWLCKICYENEIGATLGCGHTFCIKCSTKVEKCPLCNSLIRDRVMLFL